MFPKSKKYQQAEIKITMGGSHRLTLILLLATPLISFYALPVQAQFASVTDGYAAPGTYASARENGVAIGTIRSTPAADPTGDRYYTYAEGMHSTAVGAGAKALDANSSAFGVYSVADGYGTVAIGSSAKAKSTASATPAIAFGTNASAEGNATLAIGANANAQADYAMAIGFRLAAGNNSLVAGNTIAASVRNSIALGSNFRISSAESIAIGSSGQVSGFATVIGTGSERSTLVGFGARVGNNAGNSLALGDTTRVESNATKSVALGSGATVSHSNSLALGAASHSGAVEIGPSDLYGTSFAGVASQDAGTVSFGSVGTERQLLNVAAGVVSSTSTTAVNGSQLFAVSTGLNNLGTTAAAAIGGGAKFDPSTGEMSQPNFNISGQDHDNVGGALEALDGLAVKYDQNADGSPNYERLSLSGSTKGSRISNVAAGIEANDAANVIQLTAALDALGGGAGLNADGSVKLPEYEVGGSKYSTIGDALAATNQSAVQYVRDTDGKLTNAIQLTGDSSGAPVTISNVAQGKVRSDAASYGQVLDVRDQSFAYTDKKVGELHSALSGDIRDLRKEARGGIASVSAAAGLRYDNTPGKTSIAAGLGGFKDAVAIAAGIGYTSEDSRTRFNASVGHSFETSDLTWNVGVSWTLD